MKLNPVKTLRHDLAVGDLRVIRGAGGRDVVRVCTPSGVVGYIAADISDTALTKFAGALRKKLLRSGIDPR